MRFVQVGHACAVLYRLLCIINSLLALRSKWRCRHLPGMMPSPVGPPPKFPRGGLPTGGCGPPEQRGRKSQVLASRSRTTWSTDPDVRWASCAQSRVVCLSSCVKLEGRRAAGRCRVTGADRGARRRSGPPASTMTSATKLSSSNSSGSSSSRFDDIAVLLQLTKRFASQDRWLQLYRNWIQINFPCKITVFYLISHHIRLFDN